MNAQEQIAALEKAREICEEVYKYDDLPGLMTILDTLDRIIDELTEE